MKEDNIKRVIKACLSIALLAVILVIVVTIMMKYNVEGEKNMPFKLSKITIISTAEGIEDSQNDNNVKWKLNILQNNDLYFTISKNENYDKEDIIESVKIENIKIVSEPKVGRNKSLYA